MSLRQRQSEFIRDLGLLIAYAYDHGYELTGGDLWASKGEGRKHSKHSKHYDRLAVDLNLFRNGVLLTKTSDHKLLGDYWESLSLFNRWGGRYEDGNHYESLMKERNDETEG